MRDAFGGAANLVIIVVFLVLVSGYLAFNVNYTKAFRVKNKIVSTFEQYEGNCGDENSDCNKKIVEYMQSVGYNAPDFTINSAGWSCPQGKGYCYKGIQVQGISDGKPRAYYKIVTQINIDIPIINKILPGLKIFQVSGDTKAIIVTKAIYDNLCPDEQCGG